MAIAAGDVDFFVLYTNDIATNPMLMDKLVAARIPTLTIATAAIASNGTEAPLIFGHDDNYNGAFLAAEALAQAARARGWAGQDIVFVSMGFLEAGGVFLTRTRGAIDGMRSVFPNVEYIETSSTGSAEVAFQRMTDILMTIPRGKRILGWTHSDDVTASLLAAIRNADRMNDALLVSGGLSMQMLDMLRDPRGIIIGSIDQNWGLFGPTILSYAINYLNDGTAIPPLIDAPFELLTPLTVNYKYPPR
jgi:ABC-type sugar transport system substrate-binding protein